MARVSHGRGRQGHDAFRQATDERSIVSTLEVGTPDAAHEERVARKEHACLTVVEAQSARRMSGRRNHLEHRLPEGHTVAVLQCRTHLLAESHVEMVGQPFAHHERHLLPHTLIEIGVGRRSLRSQAIVAQGETVAQRVVEVQVRVEQVTDVQAVLLNIVANLPPFAFGKAAAVNDDSLAALVAHHVGVLLQRIHRKQFRLLQQPR